jgi:pimeloyl-ACP methyl ester carboxylesterase
MREDFTADVVGGSLAGWVQGDGPPVLLLHGGPGVDFGYLDEIAAEIGSGFRIAGYQQRGIAPSTLEGPFSVGQEVEDAVRVLDALGWERTYVVGHSWGGHLALRLTAARPDRLLGTLAVDPLGVAGDGGAAAFGAEMMARTPAAARSRAAEILAAEEAGETSEAEQLELMRIGWPAYFADPEHTAPLSVRAMSAEANGAIGHTIGDGLEAVAAGLGEGRVPVTVLAGGASPMPWGQAARASADLSPGARLVVVPNAGHFVWWEAPGCVRDALRVLAGA